MGNSTAKGSGNVDKSRTKKFPAKVRLASQLTRRDFDFVPNFILVGDSVLDNQNWVSNKKSKTPNDVANQLNTALKQIDKDWEACATNLAIDGSTTHGLLNNLTVTQKKLHSKKSLHRHLKLVESTLTSTTDGKSNINTTVDDTKQDSKGNDKDKKNQSSENKDSGDKVNSDVDDKDQAKHVQHDNDEKMDSVRVHMHDDNLKNGRKNIVILSIGGNDVIAALGGKFFSLYQQFEKEKKEKKEAKKLALEKTIEFLNDKSKFYENYCKILDIIINECNVKDIIMVLVYEPYIGFCKSYSLNRDDLLVIIEWGAKMLFKIAQEHNLAIIDLSRTCDPFNKHHFSKASPIEPNEKGGSFLVDLVLYCISNYNEQKRNKDNGGDQNNSQKCSMIYYGNYDNNGRIIAQENTSKAREQYLNNKLAVHPSP